MPVYNVIVASTGALLNTGPTSPTDIKQHLSRLFVLGGTVPSATGDPVGTVYKNRLYWSDVGGPTAAAGSWQDDVSGLANQITITSDGDEGVALARVGQHLAILMRRSIYLVMGSAPTAFSMRRLTSEFGCLSADTVVEVEDGCFFLSDAGLAFFDGVQVRLVGTEIRSRLRPAGVTPTYSASVLDLNHIMFTVANGAAVEWWILNRAADSWSRFTVDSNIMATSAPYQVGRTKTKFFAWDGNRIWRLDDLVHPGTKAGRGIDNKAGTTKRTPSTWRSRRVRLAAPLQAARLQRLVIDYIWNVDGAASDGLSNAWRVAVVNERGESVLAATAVPAQAQEGSSAYTYERRQVIDLMGEAEEIQVRIDLDPAGTTTMQRAEIHDVWIDYAPAQQRRSA